MEFHFQSRVRGYHEYGEQWNTSSSNLPASVKLVVLASTACRSTFTLSIVTSQPHKFTSVIFLLRFDCHWWWLYDPCLINLQLVDLATCWISSIQPCRNSLLYFSSLILSANHYFSWVSLPDCNFYYMPDNVAILITNNWKIVFNDRFTIFSTNNILWCII